MLMLERPISRKIYEEMCTVIPGGVNSPVRACKAIQQLPLVAVKGAGDQIFDADGNAFIDYCGSWGALIHGHAHPGINEAVQQRLALGSTFGVTTPIEGELAKKITTYMNSIKKIRFVSTGTEATMSAARLARGFTGRQFIIKFNGNYHGHADFFLVKAGSGAMNLAEASSAGIPLDLVKHTLSLPYNDVEACRTVFRDPKINNLIAAVIVEPIAGNMGVVPATAAFLQMLREETQKNGSVLIFDEVISGFRVALGGAQSIYGIEPDLTCLGKIIGGGFPAAAFGGRKEIMDCLAPLGGVYQAGTLSGNPVAMEAGLQTLNLLSEKAFYSTLEEKANIITQPVKAAMEKKKTPACIQQVGSMFTLFFGKKTVLNMDDAQQLDFDLFGNFFRFLFKNGVYIPPAQQEAWFVSNAHTTEHLEKTRDLILQFLKTIP